MPINSILMTSNKYNATKIAEKAQEYNLIIFTTQGTFDTTNYNLSSSVTESVSNKLQDASAGENLILAYNPKGAVKITSTASDFKEFGKSGHKIIEFSDRSITKVVIKSKRNFMLNQGELKKL